MSHRLLVDMHYLCHRALHSTGKLSHLGDPTGVIYGVLRELLALDTRFSPSHWVLAFDSKVSLRRRIYPKYKANRAEKEARATEEEQQVWAGFAMQLNRLREEILPTLGFRNVLLVEGYEADDLIAAIAHGWRKNSDKKVIVSADHDLFQLLTRDTKMWMPSKSAFYTLEDFQREFKLEPWQWVQVKAIAGCSSDNVQGIRGVGEKTAAKFLAGTLSRTCKQFVLIVNNHAKWQRNQQLVELPFPGLKVERPEPDGIDARSWNRQLARFGIESLHL